jgi:hypothetical protein
MSDAYDPEEDRAFIGTLIFSFTNHGIINFDNLCSYEEYPNLFLDETY